MIKSVINTSFSKMFLIHCITLLHHYQVRGGLRTHSMFTPLHNVCTCICPRSMVSYISLLVSSFFSWLCIANNLIRFCLLFTVVRVFKSTPLRQAYNYPNTCSINAKKSLFETKINIKKDKRQEEPICSTYIESLFLLHANLLGPKMLVHVSLKQTQCPR